VPRASSAAGRAGIALVPEIPSSAVTNGKRCGQSWFTAASTLRMQLPWRVRSVNACRTPRSKPQRVVQENQYRSCPELLPQVEPATAVAYMATEIACDANSSSDIPLKNTCTNSPVHICTGRDGGNERHCNNDKLGHIVKSQYIPRQTVGREPQTANLAHLAPSEPLAISNQQ
jgi:hypothetical protein